MTEQILYQSVQPQNELSNELRSVIRDNVLQFYVQSSAQQQEEGITALYERRIQFLTHSLSIRCPQNH